MEIIVVVLALAFLQIWGAQNPLHKDGWFFWWRSKLARLNSSSETELSETRSFLNVVWPLVLVAIVFQLLLSQSIWLVMPLAVVVLLYSLGRGEFFEIVREYTQACYIEDWDSACERARRFDVEVDDLERDDWSSLHRHVLDQAGYRGFERMFAVLFWFFLLGPVGALMYRLVFLQSHAEPGDKLSQRWLWLLEWPAVRLLGLTFALTGNFQGCIEHWRDCLLCGSRRTNDILSPMILGALAVSDDTIQDGEITRKELTLMSKLFQRSLWFWIAVAALFSLFA
ncbi:histidine kinase [Agaribacterium haliotis]|uniref:histidine kinase n=1 Tax=Agaribacterium haliotis TaxID=2013869 RepID=UPI000BB59F98|nr:histidine kinase [Agaribacterium haliotis]